VVSVLVSGSVGHRFKCGRYHLRGRRISSSVPVLKLRVEHKRRRMRRPQGVASQLLYKLDALNFSLT